MSRYVIWDKKSDIWTQGPDAETGRYQWTAQEYIDKMAPWAANPAVKVVVGGGAVNGRIFMEFGATVEHYKRIGVNITEGMTDREILDAIEHFEDNPPEPPVSDTERIAAALEFQNLLGM